MRRVFTWPESYDDDNDDASSENHYDDRKKQIFKQFPSETMVDHVIVCLHWNVLSSHIKMGVFHYCVNPLIYV